MTSLKPFKQVDVIHKIAFYLFNLKCLFIYGSSMLCSLFSRYGEWGLLFSCSMLASHHGGFFCCGVQALGNGTPLQYSCLENPVDGGAWWAAVHGVTRSQTQLSDFTFTSHFPALEKEMATHSSVLAWRIPGTGELGGLLSLGSHRVGHDWSDLAAVAADINSCGGRGKLVLWCTLYKGSAIMA